MKIDKKCKIELACSDNATRLPLMNPYLDGSQLIATDGRKMAVLNIEREGTDKNGYIPGELIKQNRATVRKGNSGSIEAKNGSATTNTKTGLVTQERNPDHNRFPNYNQVLPDNCIPVARITLDPRKLWELAQALGATEKGDSIDLVIQEKGSESFQPVIMVSDHGFGLLMPIRPDSTVHAPRHKCNFARRSGYTFDGS